MLVKVMLIKRFYTIPYHTPCQHATGYIAAYNDKTTAYNAEGTAYNVIPTAYVSSTAYNAKSTSYNVSSTAYIIKCLKYRA
jgi:hypothetical protein